MPTKENSSAWHIQIIGSSHFILSIIIYMYIYLDLCHLQLDYA